MNSSKGNATLPMDLASLFVRVRRMFYLITPGESSFNQLEKVPKYVDQAIPVFILFLALELLGCLVKGRDKFRFNDGFSSVSAGLLSRLPLLIFRNIELTAYIWVWENLRFKNIELPWDSPWTWIGCMLGTDFGYYWVHRYSHEINMFWAAHQAHHSSEDYNLTTALRQSVMQPYISWIFYLPMALFVPPSIFLVHIQFNLIYQFWIHTEVIDNVGPLEWILNTPSHHRLHHGTQDYCLDKNYAGTLIIWDRIFGTERQDDKPVYGLTTNIDTWNPMFIQYQHFLHIIRTAWKVEGLGNKVSMFVQGPGWVPPGLAETHNEETNLKSTTRQKYNKDLSLWWDLYCWIHCLTCVAIYSVTSAYKHTMSQWQLMLIALYILWTITTIGFIYEHRWYAPVSELIRCAVFLTVDWYMCGLSCHMALYMLRILYGISMFVAAVKCAALYKLVLIKKVD